MYCLVRSWDSNVEKNVIVTSDAIGYQQLAENILHYHTFAGTTDTASIPLNSHALEPGLLIANYDTYREPGYPAFLAFVYLIAGVKPFIAILIQLILNAICVVLIYRIAFLLFNNKIVATIAALLFTLDIHSIYVANVLYSDTLFIFLFLLSLYYFFSGLKILSFIRFVLSALFLGLACITRPVSLLYPFVLFFVVFVFNKGMERRWLVKIIIPYMLIIYAIVGGWVLRNHTSYNRWQLTTMDGYNLLDFNVAFTESRKTNLPIETVRGSLLNKADSLGCLRMRNPFDRSKICGKVAWEYIRNNKVAYTETQLWGAIHMFLSLGNIDIAQTLGWRSSDVEGQLVMDSNRIKQNFAHKGQAILGVLIILVLLLQYIGAFIGFVFLIKNKNWFVLVFGILTIFYFSAITGAIGKYRYKLPMQFTICAISGYGYYSLIKRKSIT